jgi:hypothetical protein
VATLALTLGLIGCGDDRNAAAPSGAPGGAQPTPGAPFYTTGTFDDISLPAGATEVGTKTEEDGAITQSFAVTSTGPDLVMDFFVETLGEQGWIPVEPVEPRGADTLFGAWDRNGRRLEVSAGPAPGIADDTQLNLVLLPSPEPGSQLNTAP